MTSTTPTDPPTPATPPAPNPETLTHQLTFLASEEMGQRVRQVMEDRGLTMGEVLRTFTLVGLEVSQMQPDLIDTLSRVRAREAKRATEKYVLIITGKATEQAS